MGIRGRHFVFGNWCAFFKDFKVGLNSNCSFRLVGKEGVAEGCDLETARSSIN